VWSVVLAGCGKKGPPLPPFVRLPAAVESVTASRVGAEVYLSFIVPRANVDRSTPIDLAYVDIYADTGLALPRAGLVSETTRVARVPVAPPPPEGTPPPPAGGAAAVGSTISIVDRLDPGAPADARRYYLVVPFSTRERPGAQHAPVEVRLTPAPAPPTRPSVTYTSDTLRLTWTPTPAPLAPAAAAPPTAAPPAPPAPSAPPAPQATPPAPASLPVNVYRVADAATPPAPWQRVRPSPINGRPIAAPQFTEPVVFDRSACFVLRSVLGEGDTAVEGEASPQVCVTPIDTFPPAAPTQLVAVATASGISLLWEAVADADVAGYLILRGAPGDVALRPLTPAPVTDVRYLDATAVSGMRYVYAVVAVDGRTPTPNTSPESARVEETAR